MDFTPLDTFMKHMAKERTPGNAIEVYLRGKLVYCQAEGYRELESKTPLTGEELFHLYSCSKVATVTAGAQLLEQGRFRLEDPLYAYLPEFRHMQVQLPDGTLKEAQNPITIEQLFTMTAGFTYQLDTPGFRKGRERTKGKMDTVEVIRSVAEDPLAFEPGSHWQYSICHDVLAAVISEITGKKFRDYMKENIFAPLEMHTCTYHPTEAEHEKIAPQYAFVEREGETFDLVEAQKHGNAAHGIFENRGKENGFCFGEEYDSGGAGITCSISDYGKLAAALASYGKGINGERILQEETVRLMQTNRLNERQRQDFNWKQLAGCGYGLGVRTHMEPEVSGLSCNLGEFGWGGAAGSTVMVDPSIGLGVFYAQHNLNPREEYYQPRLRDVIYQCLR